MSHRTLVNNTKNKDIQDMWDTFLVTTVLYNCGNCWMVPMVAAVYATIAAIAIFFIVRIENLRKNIYTMSPSRSKTAKRTRRNKAHRRSFRSRPRSHKRRRGGSAVPAIAVPALIVGKIYATWCGHCQALEKPWEEVKKTLHRANPSVRIYDIEEQDMVKKLAEVNRPEHGITPGNEVKLQGGFPTIFKIIPAEQRVEYYQGERNAHDMAKWASARA